MNLVSLQDRHPEAVCMDESPSGYYWLPATADAGRNTWIFYLESGGWCWDKKSCAQRCAGKPELCSSYVWGSTKDLTGIFSHTNEEVHESLRTANKVFVAYCTSDAHMGDAQAFGYEFRGARVVQAVLTDLVQLYGLGRGDQGKKDFLLFGGGSAGARGAMVHLDFVPSMLGSAAEHVEVVGFLDSPLWMDVKPVNETFFDGFGNQTARVHSFTNVSHLDDDCTAAYPDEQWKCMLGQYRMHFVETRYLMVAALHDSFQLYFDSGGADWKSNWTDEQLAFARQFANRTAVLAGELVSSQGRSAVFGHACLNHAESLNDRGFFSHSTQNGETVSIALHQFLGLDGNANAGGNLSWIDDCFDLDCGRGCHIGDCEGEHANDEGCDPGRPSPEDTVVQLSAAPRAAPAAAWAAAWAAALLLVRPARGRA